MSKFIPVVPDYSEGGDSLFWFAFVIIEAEDSANIDAIRNALTKVTRESILVPEDEDDPEPHLVYGDSTPAKLEAVLRDAGFNVKVHPAEGLDVVAEDEY